MSIQDGALKPFPVSAVAPDGSIMLPQIAKVYRCGSIAATAAAQVIFAARAEAPKRVAGCRNTKYSAKRPLSVTTAV